MQLGCQHELRIFVLDPDGDKVTCQWAGKSECKAVCDALPGADLDEVRRELDYALSELCVLPNLLQRLYYFQFRHVCFLSEFPKENKRLLQINKRYT